MWKLWVPERHVGQQRDVCVSFMSTGGRTGRTRGQEHFVEVFGAFTRRMNCHARFSVVSFSRLMIKAQARKRRRRDGAKALLPFSEKDSGCSSLLKSRNGLSKGVSASPYSLVALFTLRTRRNEYGMLNKLCKEVQRSLRSVQ